MSLPRPIRRRPTFTQAGGPTRRRFLGGVAGTVAFGSFALAGCGGGGSDDGDDVVAPPAAMGFQHGVASGDPLADRVILWTRISTDTAGDVDVSWQVATDAGFSAIVAEGSTATGAATDHTVKVDVTGLSAGTRYWYRFQAGDDVSPVGVTKTLPTGTVQQVRLAVFSCASYPTGFFNAYAHAALRDDLDATVHLGDYIYEYGPGEFPLQPIEDEVRDVAPPNETVDLAAYRLRHAQCKTDPDLQALHALAPMIAVWDDHEIANDSWLAGAENHDPATEGPFGARKAAALQAYHEWMPTRVSQPEIIYRSFEFGSLMALHMLDTRVVGRDEQLSFDDYGSGVFDAPRFEADVNAPERQLLGTSQTQWLQGQLQASTATWQVLGQQVLMGRMRLPFPLATQSLSVADYLELRLKELAGTLNPDEQALLNTADFSVPYNLDAWDGYGAARETVFGAVRALDHNLVVLSGDTHNAWANDLLDAQGQPVGVEFAVSSVTSPGIEDFLPSRLPSGLADELVDLIEPLKYCNTQDRGYMLLTVTPQACQADWLYVGTIETRDASAAIGKTLQTLPGAGGRRIVEVAA